MSLQVTIFGIPASEPRRKHLELLHEAFEQLAKDNEMPRIYARCLDEKKAQGLEVRWWIFGCVQQNDFYLERAAIVEALLARRSDLKLSIACFDEAANNYVFAHHADGKTFELISKSGALSGQVVDLTVDYRMSGGRLASSENAVTIGLRQTHPKIEREAVLETSQDFQDFAIYCPAQAVDPARPLPALARLRNVAAYGPAAKGRPGSSPADARRRSEEAMSYFAKAQELMDSDPAKSAEHFESALLLNPQNIWAHTKLAEVSEKLERSQSAEKHYRRAIELIMIQSRQMTGKAYQIGAPARSLARLLITQDRSREAVSVCEQTLAAVPVGNAPRASAIMNARARSYICCQLIWAFYRLDRNIDAYQAIESALENIERDPGRGAASYLMEVITLHAEDYTKAVKVGDKLQAMRVRSAGTFRAYARALQELGRHHDAIKAIDRAQEKVDADPSDFYAKARSYALLEDEDHCRSALRGAIAADAIFRQKAAADPCFTLFREKEWFLDSIDQSAGSQTNINLS